MEKQDEVKDNSAPELQSELSRVAVNPKQSIVVLGLLAVVFIYVFYSFFIRTESSTEKSKKVPIPDKIVKPNQDYSVKDSVPDIPSLPTLPDIQVPIFPEGSNNVSSSNDISPPPPPISVSPTSGKDILPELPKPGDKVSGSHSATNAPSLPSKPLQTGEQKQAQQRKRQSAIFLVSGTSNSKTTQQVEEEAGFVYRGDMSLLLSKGKVIDAVVETAINTDIGGEIRAVITRDVYSRGGRNILIPKGSTIFGNYSTGINGSYGRVNIEWTRVDLLNGYTLNLSAIGVDNLGRKGNQGRVDNKFKERLTNSVLSSALDIALAKTFDSVVKPPSKSNDAATKKSEATNIQNTANTIFAESGLDPATKRANICNAVLNIITDKTSPAFTQTSNACSNPQGDTPEKKLLSVMQIIAQTANALLSSVNNSTDESKAQQASEKGFKNVSGTIKSLVEEQKLLPTITIEQGTVIKVYVNQDYKFPESAVSKFKGGR